MVIKLSQELEAAVNEVANRRGIPADVLAINALRERFLGAIASLEPRDEWEKGLLAAAKDCGISLPNSVLTSEAFYD